MFSSLLNSAHELETLLLSSLFLMIALLSLAYAHREQTGDGTWEDKCSVKLNKHDPDMRHSGLSVADDSQRSPESISEEGAKIRCQPREATVR